MLKYILAFESCFIYNLWMFEFYLIILNTNLKKKKNNIFH